ncbi:MAG: acetyl-CoA carboxylase carboxyl transferase subunit alpha, partial [Calditrichaeota bacterium]|nr:acetyl-CoA carboxylase carboxyl transferase subunit alpha [Calditrichota bacterium]
MKRHTIDFEKPLHELEDKINELEKVSRDGGIGMEKEIERLRRKMEKMRINIYSNLNRWQIVQLARHPNRPYTLDYIKYITTDFIELKG